MNKKMPDSITYQELINWYNAVSNPNLTDFKKYKIAMQKEVKQITSLNVHIDNPLQAHIDAMKASYDAFEKMLTPLKATAPLINSDFIIAWEAAEREADELIHFINATHVPFTGISKLPPVKMMTVLAIMSKVEAEPLRIKEKILKSLEIGRCDGVAKRKRTATQNTNVIQQAIDDLFKNRKGWEMTIEEIADFLIDRQISRYQRSTTLGKVKKLVPSIKQKYKSGQ